MNYGRITMKTEKDEERRKKGDRSLETENGRKRK